MTGCSRGRGASLVAILFELFPAALLCALFVAVGVVHVTSRVLVVNVGYRLSKLEQAARERLKMLPPPAGAVLTAPAAAPPPTAGRAAPAKPERGG